MAEFVTSGDGWNHDHMLTKWEPDLLSFRYRPPVLSSVLGTSRAKRGDRHGSGVNCRGPVPKIMMGMGR